MSPIRCPWSHGVSDAYERYHDTEWGVPVRDDGRHFEFLMLEGAQAGLSWSTVLHKRPAYRRAFAGFDPERVARFNRRSVERLLADAGIIRNRLKIEAAISNARRFLEVQDEHGSFDDYIWRFVDGRPIVNYWKRPQDVPVTTHESDALSKDLKARGFKFVGSTIIYAHMQAIGLVNDHLVDCFRHAECARLAAAG
jgi:DNA-3-methyladenine glycosylase I